MLRTVLPEILDELPADHPAALHSRRDLRRINALMGNSRWLRRELAARILPSDRVLEIGAGDGEFGRSVRAIAPDYHGLDMCPRPSDWPTASDWHQHDLRTFPGYRGHSVILANLILHQFHDDDLRTFGRMIEPHARMILACEPGRRRGSQWMFRALSPFIGANYVTRHDAHVSIAAGFRDGELAALLGLDAARWDVACGPAAMGAYHLTAVRRP